MLNSSYVFNSKNLKCPKFSRNLEIIELSCEECTNESIKGYGYLIDSLDEITIENKRFEIVKWPVSGWRTLDPETGDEGGTTEGEFKVKWEGDYYYGENLAIETNNNKYLDGLMVKPLLASKESKDDKDQIYLWMSDYHPDGGQLFWSKEKVPFMVCLGHSSYGDDIKPKNMKAFKIPAGKGIYIHPNIWHNGVYIKKKYSPQTFITRQGKVHGRVSVNWTTEFNTLIKIKFTPLKI
jgi:ureidoglycolate lyase